MADDANAGNDQQDESQTGDDQQTEATPQPDPNAEKISALENELKETNAAFTRYQQQQAQANQPVEDEPEEVDLSGLTPEQKKLIEKASGASDLRKELDELKKNQEVERQRREASQLQEKIESVGKEFSPDKGYPAIDEQKLQDHMVKTGIFNPRAAYKDMHEAAIYDVQKKAVEPKAAQGDRPDATQEPSLSKDEYQKKLLELSLAGKDAERRKLMIEHGAVVPENL